MQHNSYKQDAFARLAKQQNYRSRAALKLLEMHEKHKLFKPNDLVLDIGAAPGSWAQIAKQFARQVVGVDLLPIEPMTGVQFIQGSFHDNIPDLDFNIVISDMCPNKTGNKTVDDYKMLELCCDLLSALDTKSYDRFLCKFFYGGLEKDFQEQLQSRFKTIKILKPKASRSCSSEFYYLASK